MASVLLATSGCGPNLGTPTSVSGKVVLDGQPLSGGTVSFVRTDGGPAEHRARMAKTDESGQYKIDKIYPGDYQVNVLPAVMPDPMKQSADLPFAPAGGAKMATKIGSDKATFDIQLTKQKTKQR
jgi:hypothetical protein